VLKRDKATKRKPISYSIWLMPDGYVYAKLKKKISELSNSFEGIKFVPHVTLLSGLLANEKILINKTKIISKKIKPFFLDFKEIDYRNEFFRSFFIKINFNSQFENARKLFCSEFSKKDEDFIPHLSLAYGLLDSTLKKNLKSNICNKIKGFEIRDIFLAHNDEINYKWKVVKKFQLLK